MNYTQHRDNNCSMGNDGNMEKRWKPVSTNNKLVQEPEGNEEIRYPDPDSKKTKISMPKNPMKPTRTL
jgi:hypothetical protein